MDAHLINLLMSAMLTALRRGWITLYVVLIFIQSYLIDLF